MYVPNPILPPEELAFDTYASAPRPQSAAAQLMQNPQSRYLPQGMHPTVQQQQQMFNQMFQPPGGRFF